MTECFNEIERPNVTLEMIASDLEPIAQKIDPVVCFPPGSRTIQEARAIVS